MKYDPIDPFIWLVLVSTLLIAPWIPAAVFWYKMTKPPQNIEKNASKF